MDIVNTGRSTVEQLGGVTFFVSLEGSKVLQKRYTLYIFCNTLTEKLLQKIYISITLKNYMLQKIYTPVYFLQHFDKKSVAKNIQICGIPIDPCTKIQYIFDVERDMEKNRISPPRYRLCTRTQPVFLYTAKKLTKNIIISDIFSTSKKGVYIFCNSLSYWYSSCKLVYYSYHKSLLTVLGYHLEGLATALKVLGVIVYGVKL